MKHASRITAMVIGFGLIAGAAWADNRALILANDDYRYAPDIRGAGDADRANLPLRGAGFNVVLGNDLTAD